MILWISNFLGLNPVYTNAGHTLEDKKRLLITLYGKAWEVKYEDRIINYLPNLNIIANTYGLKKGNLYYHTSRNRSYKERAYTITCQES